MFALKIVQVLAVETIQAKDSDRKFKKWKLICDDPYFDPKTGVHALQKVVYAASSENFDIRKTKTPSFVFVSQSKRGLWLQGPAN